MKLIKTINRENEIVKFYNQPLNGGESIIMGGRQYWMIREFKNLKENKLGGFGKSNIREKQCGNCNTNQSVQHFYNDSYSKDGYSHWCKSCCKTYHKNHNKELKLVA